MPDDSGSITLKNSLRDNVKLKRLARAIGKLHGFPDALALTVALGGLTKLWMHGYAFARDDDTMAITLDEIDELAGLQGFAELLPTNWLEVLDAQHVRLPGFRAQADELQLFRDRTRSKAAARQARYRERHTTPDSNVTSRHVTLPGDVTVTPSLSPEVPLPSSPPLTLSPSYSPPPPTPTPSAGNGGTHENGSQKAPDLSLPGNLPVDAWQEWLAYRRRRKWPMDQTTLGKHLAILARYDTQTQRAIIDTSIGSGWQGLFAPKGRPDAAPQPSTWQPPPDDPDVHNRP